MTFDINLRANIDRSNSDPISLITNPTLKENTLLWHKGGLHSIFKQETDEGFLDAFERNISIKNANELFVDDKSVGLINNTIGKPIKGTRRFYYNQFIPEIGDIPVHNDDGGITVSNNNIHFNGNSYPINPRAEFFRIEDTVYEIEQSSNTNRAFNLIDNTVSITLWNYCAINKSKIILSRIEDQSTLGDDSELVIIYNTMTSEFEQSIIRPNAMRCYSVAQGPGYLLSFWINANGNYYCYWINENVIAESFQCSSVTIGDAKLLPVDSNTNERPIAGVNDFRKLTSTVATTFSYVTGSFIIYKSTCVGQCNADTIITAPLTTFSVFHSATNSQIFSDYNNYYHVQLNVMPFIQKMSEYVWQVNDGSCIVSNNDESKFEPKLPINLGFLHPYVERTVPVNTTASTILMGSSNNANYETNNNRQVGSITPQFTIILNGIGYNNFSSIGASKFSIWKGDYYFATLSSASARYRFSTDGETKFINKALNNLMYPSSSNSIFTIPCNSTRIKTRTPSILFKWADVITANGLVNNTRTMLAYYLFSTFYGGETFFFLLRNYYFFDGEIIYESNKSPGEAAWDGSIAAIGEGLTFLSSDSQQALFYSKIDKWIYSFTGDYLIRPIIDVSNTTIIDAAYTPALDMHAFLTPTEVILLCKGQLSSIPGSWAFIDTTLNGLVLYKNPADENTGYTQLSLFEGDLVEPHFELGYCTLKESYNCNFQDVYIKFKKLNDNKASINLTSKVMLTADHVLTKNTKQDISFDESNDYKIVKLPIASNGRALSLDLKSTNSLQIHSITVEAEIISKSSVKSNQAMI